MKLAWLVRVFEQDDEALHHTLPKFYSARRIVYMEVEE